MDDNYLFTIFFECHNLLEEQKKKIETYFCIRRKSSGGECGPLRRVNDKVYSVAFRHQRGKSNVMCVILYTLYCYGSKRTSLHLKKLWGRNENSTSHYYYCVALQVCGDKIATRIIQRVRYELYGSGVEKVKGPVAFTVKKWVD